MLFWIRRAADFVEECHFEQLHGHRIADQSGDRYEGYQSIDEFVVILRRLWIGFSCHLGALLYQRNASVLHDRISHARAGTYLIEG